MGRPEELRPGPVACLRLRAAPGLLLVRGPGRFRDSDGAGGGQARRLDDPWNRSRSADRADRSWVLCSGPVHELTRRVAGEPVRAFIFGMAGMALNPMPFHLMRGG